MFAPFGATKHYGEAIKKELQKRHANVILYDERPSQSSSSKIIIRLLKKKLPQLFGKYIQRIIFHNKQSFDYILICRGEAFTELTIKMLRSAYPNAKIILYLWDILRTTNVKEIIPLCDRALTFDPDDADENDHLIFRPTFFVDDYTKISDCSDCKYDIAFIGTLHSNRHITISNFKRFFLENGINAFMYLYVPSRIVYIKNLILKFPYISLKKVKFKPISLEDTIKVVKNSKALLDINYTQQKSLSMRAYEAMAAHRKYITTNQEVIKYDFYNPRNVLVIDINNPKIPKEFLHTPFESIPNNIMYKYSVAGLVDDLFDIKNL